MTREATEQARGYGRAAGLLTVTFGLAGLLTYGFFALASHNLDTHEYGQIVVLWSAVFILISVLFRPVEQLLSRTIAEQQEHGREIGHALRVAALIQTAIAAAFALLAFALRGLLEGELLDDEPLLFFVMVGAVLAFGFSFFARGYLAGSRQFAVYGLLLLVESSARLAFAFAVAVGIASGMDAVAVGIAIAPVASLVVIPLALRRLRESAVSSHDPGAAPAAPGARAVAADVAPEFTLGRGGGFAAAVLLIMLSEQVFLNGGPLFARASEGASAAGFIFNVLMVARAPIVLFQAVAASLLPHLTRLRSRGDQTSAEAFGLSVRLTITLTTVLAALAVVAMLLAGPDLMQIAFGEKFEYDREGLAIVAAGMGFYLAAATLNQAALAQGQARRAAICWAVCAAGFIAWNLAPAFDVFRRVEIGYAVGAASLCGLLYLVYRRPHPRGADAIEPDSPEEIEARLATVDEVA